MIRRLFLSGLSVFISMFLVGHIAYAQLESIDIGDAENTPGSTEIRDGTYTIEADGHDIWLAADGFRFAYTEASGDLEAMVHLVSFEPANEWSKAAIMARQSVDADAANIIATVTGGGGGGSQITWRPSKGSETSEFMDAAPGPWKEGNCWLKLTREGDEFHGYISGDGEEWKDLKSQKVELDDPILVGLAVTSKQSGTLVTAVFDNFTITQNGKGIFPAVKPEGKLPITWAGIKLRQNL